MGALFRPGRACCSCDPLPLFHHEETGSFARSVAELGSPHTPSPAPPGPWLPSAYLATGCRWRTPRAPMSHHQCRDFKQMGVPKENARHNGCPTTERLRKRGKCHSRLPEYYREEREGRAPWRGPGSTLLSSYKRLVLAPGPASSRPWHLLCAHWAV